MNRNKWESNLIYIIGFTVTYFSLFFISMKFNYGDVLYGISEFVSPTFELVLLFLGLGILLFQGISFKDLIRVFSNADERNVFPSVGTLIALGFVIMIISALLPALYVFMTLLFYILMVSLVLLVIRKDILYLSTLIFIMIQFLDDIFYSVRFDIIYMILVLVGWRLICWSWPTWSSKQ